MSVLKAACRLESKTQRFFLPFSVLRLKTDEKQASPACSLSSYNTAIPFWLGPLQPALAYIPPCCTPPLLNLLLRLSATACIHFKTLLLLFRATKKALPSHFSAILQPLTTPANVCYSELPSVCLWPDYRFTQSRLFSAAAPLMGRCTFKTLWQLLPFLCVMTDLLILLSFMLFRMCVSFCST